MTNQTLSGRIAVFVATGFGVGFAPFAPGTFGSLWGLPLVWTLLKLPLFYRLGLPILLIIIGIPICGKAAKVLGVKDPGAVVLDEIAAFPVVFLAVLLGHVPFTWITAGVGFVLFRLFDITKLWPARQLEFLPGGTGVMADDLAAGIYAGCLLGLVPLLNLPLT